jgi:pimeloyl-ACP methyl ester carboxylesterase
MAIIDGRYLSCGNKNLYIKPTGSGLPTIVIETAWGSLSAEWQPIQDELSKHTTVISYDRAGYGESPTNISPRSSKQIVNELYTLLSNTGIPGPYLFIAEASGGFYIQHFARLYPELAAGMILVDSTTSRIFEFDELDAPKFQEVLSLHRRMEGLKAFTLMKEDDFNKTVPHFLKDLFPQFPKDLQQQITAYMCDQQLYKTVIDEYEALRESVEQFANAGDFPQIPLSILCRDPKIMIETAKQIGVPEEEAKLVEDLWLAQSEALQSLSNDTSFKIVEGGVSSLHLSHPQIIIEESLKMLDKLSGLSALMQEGRVFEI